MLQEDLGNVCQSCFCPLWEYTINEGFFVVLSFCVIFRPRVMICPTSFDFKYGTLLIKYIFLLNIFHWQNLFPSITFPVTSFWSTWYLCVRMCVGSALVSFNWLHYIWKSFEEQPYAYVMDSQFFLSFSKMKYCHTLLFLLLFPSACVHCLILLHLHSP